MPRAPFNVLVLPYKVVRGHYEYAVFHRADGDMWQFIAGGGEGAETPSSAARREASEEGGIVESRWIELDSTASIPRDVFRGNAWPDSIYVIPQHCFAVELRASDLRLSHEHDRYEWLDYETARTRLTWDSNKVALWELRERLARLNQQPSEKSEGSH